MFLPYCEVNQMSEQTVYGYKGTNWNIECRGIQLALNQYVSVPGNVVCCGHGFHFCMNPLDIFQYYEPSFSRYFLVEATPPFDPIDVSIEMDTKRAARGIKLLREITFEEIPGIVQEYICKTDESHFVSPAGRDSVVVTHASTSYAKAKYGTAVTVGDISVAESKYVAVCQSACSFAYSRYIAVTFGENSVAFAKMEPNNVFPLVVAITMDGNSAAVVEGKGIGLTAWGSSLDLRTDESVGFAYTPGRITAADNCVVVIEFDNDAWYLERQVNFGKGTVVVFKARPDHRWRVFHVTEEYADKEMSLYQMLWAFNKQASEQDRLQLELGAIVNIRGPLAPEESDD